MSKVRLGGADPVSETLMIPLLARAREQRQPEPLVPDPLAAQLVAEIDYDWDRIKFNKYDLAAIVVRQRQFDRIARRFLAEHPTATVVQLGCGMDTRFQRVDNGQVRWFNLDLPDVIELREQLLPAAGRERNLAYSAWDLRWMDEVDHSDTGPILLLAEAVFPYFTRAQVQELILAMGARFPGSVLVTDMIAPISVWLGNLHLIRTGSKARMRWGCSDPRQVTGWGPRIQLLESFYYFDEPEPRLGMLNWWRNVPVISKGTSIQTYRLG